MTAWLYRVLVACLVAPASLAFGASIGGINGTATAVLVFAVGLTCGAAVERWYFT